MLARSYLLTAFLIAQISGTLVPARWVSGSLPSPPSPTIVGWIEEMFDVSVDSTGRVGAVRHLRSLSASTSLNTLIGGSLAGWRFQPAVETVERDGSNSAARPRPSRVLVAAIIRPPQLDNSPTLGERPTDLAKPPEEIPVPIVTVPPLYPPLATGDGMVLVEVLVGVDGRVRERRRVAGATGFEQAALDAAERWQFRPARAGGSLVDSRAYLLFGFRQPVTPAPGAPGPGR